MELFNVDPQLRRQDEAAYGPFCSADHQIGDQVKAPGVQGEIIWSYRKDGTGPVTYVIDDKSGWPVEVKANEVQG
jgi:hypothetical protein